MAVDPSTRFPSKENPSHSIESSKTYEPLANLQVSSEELIHINQLKEFILEALKSKNEGSILSSHTYPMPY